MSLFMPHVEVMGFKNFMKNNVFIINTVEGKENERK